MFYGDSDRDSGGDGGYAIGECVLRETMIRATLNTDNNIIYTILLLLLLCSRKKAKKYMQK